MSTQSKFPVLWDYLHDMPKLPSRADRESLEQKIVRTNNQQKRISIWNYFFRVKPEEVGKSEREAIENLRRHRDKELRRARNDTVRFSAYLIVLILIALGIAFQPYWNFANQYGWWTATGGVVILVLAWVLFRAWRSNFDRQIEREIVKKKNVIQSLLRQIPMPPDDDRMSAWLQRDLDGLARRAIQITGLKNFLVPLDDAPNPLCILGPAAFQSKELLEKYYLAGGDPDRLKHLGVHKLGSPSLEKFEDFYGVYYIEFIIVAINMLGNYGCFFDFVSGALSGEHVSEIYYKDVVSIGTRDEFVPPHLGWLNRRFKAPTFWMSLASGDNIQVSFASEVYIKGLISQVGKQVSFDPVKWVGNPEMAADKAIRALRHEIRQYKKM